MSYDITFRVKLEGADRYVEVGECDANITWNVRDIITLSTGLPWRNGENNGYCKYVMPHIEKGLQELRTHPERYKLYEAKNGWGTVEDTIHFYEWLLRDWHQLKRDDPVLAELATFWIC